tara:strand:+ start:317 stop:1096 length:780 start_codon:yes stop_codon:yes gene_type:complete
MGAGIADIKHFYSFSSEEYRQLFSTIFFVTAIFFLFKWRTTNLESTIAGILYFIFIFLITAVTLYVHEAMHKVVAIWKGFHATFNYWPAGGIIGVLVTFVSAGIFPLLLLGGSTGIHDPKLRLGKFRYGHNQWSMGQISLAGPLTNLFIVWLLGFIYLITTNSYIYTIIQLNLLVAVFSLLPLPKLAQAKAQQSFLQSFEMGTDGLNIYAYRPWVWVLTFASAAIFAGLVLIANVYSFVLASLLGAIVTLVYTSQVVAD